MATSLEQHAHHQPKQPYNKTSDDFNPFQVFVSNDFWDPIYVIVRGVTTSLGSLDGYN